MITKKTIYSLSILVSLSGVVFFSNYWISKQVQDIQREDKVVIHSIFKEKKIIDNQRVFVKIDAKNDPLAPMMKERAAVNLKKNIDYNQKDKVYEVSEETDILVQ